MLNWILTPKALSIRLKTEVPHAKFAKAAKERKIPTRKKAHRMVNEEACTGILFSTSFLAVFANFA